MFRPSRVYLKTAVMMLVMTMMIDGTLHDKIFRCGCGLSACVIKAQYRIGYLGDGCYEDYNDDDDEENGNDDMIIIMMMTPRYLDLSKNQHRRACATQF